MQIIQRYFVNIDRNGNEIKNEFFLQTNDKMKRDNRIDDYLYYTAELSELEFNENKNRLVIDGHIGSYMTSNREVAVLKDVFNYQPNSIEIEYDKEKAKEVLSTKKKDSVKLKILIKDEFDFEEPILIVYKDEFDFPSINRVNGRGPFMAINKKEYIEVYLTGWNKDFYILNVEYNK